MTQQDWYIEGARLTAEAIKQVMRVMPATRYEIRLIHPDRDSHQPITRSFTRAELLRSVKYLRHENRNGYHVYFRPEAPHFIYVDDVCEDDIDAMMADGIRPVLVYETSEGLYHAWVQLALRPEHLTEAEATEARKVLAERYRGDCRATGKNQLGRLPGFRNRKPEYEDSNGGFPLVKIKRATFAPIATKVLEEARKRIASAPPSPLPPVGRVLNHQDKGEDVLEIYDRGKHVVTMSAQYEIGDLDTAYALALNEMKSSGYKSPIRNSGDGVDRSKQDMAVASFLYRQCVKPELIEQIIMRGSDKAAERGTEYVMRTVKATYSMVSYKKT